jgi:hypothetical protein
MFLNINVPLQYSCEIISSYGYVHIEVDKTCVEQTSRPGLIGPRHFVIYMELIKIKAPLPSTCASKAPFLIFDILWPQFSFRPQGTCLADG